MTGGRILMGVALLAAAIAGAAGAQTVVHGSHDAYSAPGVAMAWGVSRGATEASAAIVVRLATDTSYPWIAVRGVDPFTKDEKPLVAAKPVSGLLDVRIPRAQFAETPRTEWLFFASESAARAGTPAMVVYYLGVPDTTPEFADDAKLDAYLDKTLARARAGGVKTP